MALGDTIARLSVSLGMDVSDFATGSTKAQKDLGSLRDSLAALGDRWTQTGKRLSLGVTAPLAAFGIMASKTASDAQELQSAFDETFDDLAGTMDEWARKTGDAMGRSTQSMQEMAKTFGIFFNQAAPTRKEAAEMSKTFTVLAQDLASFYNVDGDVALQKLRSGLSGESEPLRDFGVFLDEAAVKAKAMEMGLTGLGDELTQQEKIMARYALILESTKDAQGDVARTSSGTANQARGFSEALEELQVVIGTKLLPLLTPLITGVTKIVNGFNNLPSSVQTAIVAVGAMAAAIGPMMLIMGTLAATILPLFAVKFGPIGIAISALINPLGTVISLFGGMVAKLGAMTILKAVGSLLLRFAGPLGLIATAGILIYQNWDRISAVFAEFWAAAKQALGPPIQELITTLKGIFEELWSGPLGEGIQTAMGFLGEFASVVGSVFGQAVINTVKAFLNIIVGVLETLGDAIRIVNAVLNGDWRAAWAAAVSIVTRIVSPFAGVATAVIDSVRRLYTGVKTWLVDKLGVVFNWLRDKLGVMGDLFFQLYDRVVGHSYIPDLVDGIASEMHRLDTVMVDPVAKATKTAAQSFKDMAANVQATLDRLFPEVRRLLNYREDLAGLEGAGLGADHLTEARRRLNMELAGVDPVKKAEPGLDAVGPLGDLEGGLKKFEDFADRLAGKARVTTVKVAETFKDMATETIGALQRMTDAIKGGGFLDILQGVIGLGMQLGSIGAFGKKIQTNLNKIPGNANGTNNWRGGLSWVGERGPELVNLPRGSQVHSNKDSRAMMGGGTMEIRPSPLFEVYMDGKLMQAAPAIASAGGQVGMANMARHQSRRWR